MIRYPFVVLRGVVKAGSGPDVYGIVVSRHRFARTAYDAVARTNREVKRYNGQSSRSDHGVYRHTSKTEPVVGSGLWADPVSEAEWIDAHG